MIINVRRCQKCGQILKADAVENRLLCDSCWALLKKVMEVSQNQGIEFCPDLYQRFLMGEYDD